MYIFVQRYGVIESNLWFARVHEKSINIKVKPAQTTISIRQLLIQDDQR